MAALHVKWSEIMASKSVGTAPRYIKEGRWKDARKDVRSPHDRYLLSQIQAKSLTLDLDVTPTFLPGKEQLPIWSFPPPLLMDIHCLVRSSLPAVFFYSLLHSAYLLLEYTGCQLVRKKERP
jgi:hypothetical protein